MEKQHQPADQPRSVRHVWVKLDLGGPRAPEAGLVLDWRRTERGWEAWVVVVASYSTGSGQGVTVRQGWHPVVYLVPADGGAPGVQAWQR